MDIIKEVTEFIMKHVGIQGTAIILLAIVLVYVWFQHQRHKLLEEKMALVEQRRVIAASELERLSHSLREPSPAPAPVTAGGPPPILVVDDNELLRKLLSVMLRSAEFQQVATANDGQQALDFLHHQSPRLLVLDLMMPRVNGYDVLRELARQKDRFPFWFFRAMGAPKSRLQLTARFHPTALSFFKSPRRPNSLLGLSRA